MKLTRMNKPETHQRAIEERAEDLLRSPLRCTFLTIIDESGIHPAVAAVPEISMYAAALAVDKTCIWDAMHEEVMEYLPRQRLRLEGLARSILQDPKSDWWFGPLASESQCWVSRDGSKPDSNTFLPAEIKAVPSSSEKKFQRVYRCGLFTSTLVNDKSSFQALLDDNYDGIRSLAFRPPLPRWRLTVRENARIFTITCPDDWHQLCVRYPTWSISDGSDDERNLESLYPLKRLPGTSVRSTTKHRTDNCLTPNWYAVAGDYDAVHLTFGGLLTSDKVRVKSDEGWSLHRFWNAEQTLWFRWVFEDREKIPDYVVTNSPLKLRFPFLHVPERQNVSYLRPPD